MSYYVIKLCNEKIVNRFSRSILYNISCGCRTHQFLLTWNHNFRFDIRVGRKQKLNDIYVRANVRDFQVSI